MKTIVFNESCPGWSKSSDRNIIYLNLQREYLNDKLMYRGYLYLSEIYESLGVAWNPKDDNICYTTDDGPIEMQFESMGDGNYLVKIG